MILDACRNNPIAERLNRVANGGQTRGVASTRGLARTKAAIRGSWRHSLAEQLDVERDAQRELGRSADYAEGVTAFAQKRAPRFTGK